MSSFVLIPDIDAYGGDSRTSALADVLEMQAFSQTSMNTAQLADYVADAGWARRRANKFIDVGDEDLKTNPTAPDLAVGAFACISERKRLLGEQYPYGIESGTVVRHSDEAAGYDVIHGLALSHAYDLDIGVNPRDYLEEVVVRCLRAAGVRAGGMANRRRATGADFPALVREVCTELGLDGDAKRAMRREEAFDGGCDVLAYLPLEPRRRSIVAVIVQVTCTQSDRWEEKLCETRPHRWMKILSSEVSPLRVLAVPYHVATAHLNFLEEGQTSIVLDRLSLSKQMPSTLAGDDEAIFQALRTVSVEAPRGRRPRAAGAGGIR